MYTADACFGAEVKLIMKGSVTIMKIMLVDDHLLFMEGLQYLLETNNLQVIGKARNGSEAQTEARILKPDIILMDIRMPECNGIEAVKNIKAEMPDIKIIMLTTSDEDEDLFDAIRYGASGYLLKNTDGKKLVDILYNIESDELPLSPGLAARLLMKLAPNSKNGLNNKQSALPKKSSEDEAEARLSDRQIEILQLVSEGKTYKEVGEMLGITERTVKYHMSRILELLQMENRAQVLSYAYHKGYLES